VGFASIGSFIMLFFALVIVLSTFSLIYGRMVQSTTMTYDMQNQKIEDTLSTVEITNITFDAVSSPDTTAIFVQNTGKNKLSLDYVDVFIDQIRIPRESINRTFEFAPGSGTINPLQWDPDETLIISTYLDLGAGTHYAAVTTEHGTKDTKSYTVI
jgi:archaellum component FlaF (FlaF/FlaG flagellin family)